LIVVVTLPDHQEILMVNPQDAVAHTIISFQHEPIDMSDYTSVSTNDDNLIFVRRSNAWTNLTYALQNDKWIIRPTPLDSVPWRQIVYNKTDQTYWIVAAAQLVHYDKNFQLIGSYNSENGMPGAEISGLIPDNKGNIWFTTERSIFQLNPKTGTITMLGEKDGIFSGQVSAQNGTKGDDGDIYITADSGFYRISPNKYIFSPSSVYFESVKINQRPVQLPAGINQVGKLSLRYFENNIDLETGTIDYYSKGKGHIRYKLESDAKNAPWQYAPANYTIRYEGLIPGTYKLTVQSSNAGNEFNSPEKVLVIEISPAFWNTWWFRTIAIVCIGAVFYSLLRWRLHQRFRLQLERAEKDSQLALERSEKETQLAEMRQKASEMEMQALRAQMNPHFIFNSLNSINRFILQNNRAQASEYLTKFSRLVRMILQNSQASLITLESELESLQLYLEMESLRFDYHFTYKISYPKDLDVSVLKVPPLIIQPYVENAIWHGLMHKEEKGQLDIEVSQENEYLFFKITDDGIGRRRAAELASKSATKHKSMGLRITADRIAMMQSTKGNESPVTITDLVNADNSAAGTEVIINTPVIYD
jgi:signal transduction histidine kinase